MRDPFFQIFFGIFLQQFIQRFTVSFDMLTCGCMTNEFFILILSLCMLGNLS